jgi:hypothetical protein
MPYPRFAALRRGRRRSSGPDFPPSDAGGPSFVRSAMALVRRHG